jgi:hypothetical protein
LDGTIAAAVFNAPGSWHDAHLNQFLDLEQIMQHLDGEYKIAADSAFRSSPRCVRMLRETELNGMSNSEISQAQTAASRLAALRVASEWGISGVTNAFRVLRTAMPADDPVERKILWETCLRLFNVRCRLMDVCQIRTVFANRLDSNE